MAIVAFACAGQSNMVGQGTNTQAFTASGYTAQVWNGSSFVTLTDPAYGAGNGSIVPLLATHIAQFSKVDIRVIPGAVSGTPITDWLPAAGAGYYNALKTKVTNSGATMAFVLWWQGESDALSSMSQATYAGHLNTIADAFWADMAAKLVVFQLQSNTGIPDVDEARIRAAHVAAPGGNAHIAEGPDLSDITTDDEYHLETDAKLVTVAARTFDALVAASLIPLPPIHWLRT